MFVILKLVGVSPQDLLTLHQVLGSSAVRSQLAAELGILPIGRPGTTQPEDETEKWVYARLESSKYLKEYGTYTVEVRMEAEIPVVGGRLFTPASVPQAIFDALEIFGDFEELFVPSRQG